MITDSRVVTAGCVTKKRAVADGRVVTAGGVIKERLVTVRRVFAARGIAEKRESAEGVVFRTRIVREERGGSMAVFSVPLLLSNSAAAPTAVLESAVLRTERSSTDAGVEAANAI